MNTIIEFLGGALTIAFLLVAILLLLVFGLGILCLAIDAIKENR